VLTLVLYVRRRNRDPSRLLLRHLVTLIVRTNPTAILLRQHLRQRGRRRCLPLVHVTNRAYVHMRVRAFILLFGHSAVIDISDELLASVTTRYKKSAVVLRGQEIIRALEVRCSVYRLSPDRAPDSGPHGRDWTGHLVLTKD